MLEASWIHSQKKRCIKILTPEFSYEADLISQTLARYSRFGMKEDIEIQKQEPLKIEIFNFLKFINSEKCEICTLEESLKNLEDIVGIPIVYISTGPSREATIPIKKS